jgi:hypothetical protein
MHFSLADEHPNDSRSLVLHVRCKRGRLHRFQEPVAVLAHISDIFDAFPSMVGGALLFLFFIITYMLSLLKVMLYMLSTSDRHVFYLLTTSHSYDEFLSLFCTSAKQTFTYN